MLIKNNRIPIKQIILQGLFPSFIKKNIYRLKGYKIGNRVKLGFGSVIIGNDVSIGDNTSIGFFTIIRSKKIRIDRFTSIGSFVYIDTECFITGEDTRIRENVYITGLKTPDSKFKLGKRCLIGQYTFLNPTKPIEFGDDCSLGGHSKIFTHSSYLSVLEGYPVKFDSVKIGNNVWIPWDVFILPGITIGDNVLIGANSHVTKDIPSNCIASGNPAKVVVNNFPVAVPEGERELIIENILNEFKEYMIYHNFKINEIILKCGKLIEIQKIKLYHVFFGDQIPLDLKFSNDVLVVFDIDSDIKNFYDKYDIAMIISIRRKERIGTSQIGEEFCSFLSRYGIRFNRLD